MEYSVWGEERTSPLRASPRLAQWVDPEEGATQRGRRETQALVSVASSALLWFV